MMIVLRCLLMVALTNGSFLYFDRHSYDLFISESTPIYAKLGRIQAVASSTSLAVEYELHGDLHQTFYLNSSTGELTLLKPIDYETISMYKLTVEARSVSSIAPCFTELIIHVINANDHSPEINLIIYPSVVYPANIIKYDYNTYSTPFATINLKDLDESTRNLTLALNDTVHFQLQFVRQIRNGQTTEAIYILSTRNNRQLTYDESYFLGLTSCDNDQPLLCSNRSFEFRLRSNEHLCYLSFNHNYSVIDLRENLPVRTLLIPNLKNEYCEHVVFAIDDATEHFAIDASTADLFTVRPFNRTEQSIYHISLSINHGFKIPITIRILDADNHIPFLTSKHLTVSRHHFSNLHLFNSTFCRAQSLLAHYFQLLSNCTIVPLLLPPPKGHYSFSIELNQRIQYQDTFRLELDDSGGDYPLASRHSQWLIILSIILSCSFVLAALISTIVIVRQKHYPNDPMCHDKQRASPSSENDHDDDDDVGNDHCHQYNALSSKANLEVHDDHDPSLSPGSTAIYLVQKPSSPHLSTSPARDDEGYSGSSDVSDHHVPLEANIISANELLEQFRVHELQHGSSTRYPVYDVPRRSSGRALQAACMSTEISLV